MVPQVVTNVSDQGGYDSISALNGTFDTPASRLTASRPQLPCTVPESQSPKGRMSAAGTQSQGDTQAASEWVLNDFTNQSRELRAARRTSTWGRGPATESTSMTCLPGQTGHIDLLGAYGDPSPLDRDASDHEDLEDELGAMSQLPEVRAEPFPESKRFRQPTTPASMNKKRKRHDLTSPTTASTPGRPVNPFAGQPNGADGLMDPSQLFKATQAPSSPLPTMLPSDGLSDRPSPNFNDMQRPSTADQSSSPIKRPALATTRSVPDPQTKYISMKESQEERDRRRLEETRRRQAEALAESSDDGFESDDSIVRSYNLRRKMELGSHPRFSTITADRRPGSNGRVRGQRQGRGRGRGGERGRGLGNTHRDSRSQSDTISPSASKPEPVLISDDASPEAALRASESETEHEEDPIQVTTSQVQDLTEENKENIGSSGIQVPGTVSKLRSETKIIQRSPLMQRARIAVGRNEIDLPGTASTDKTEEFPKASPAFDVANSQPVEKGSHIGTINQAVVPASSPDSRAVVPHSQPQGAHITEPKRDGTTVQSADSTQELLGSLSRPPRNLPQNEADCSLASPPMSDDEGTQPATSSTEAPSHPVREPHHTHPDGNDKDQLSNATNEAPGSKVRTAEDQQKHALQLPSSGPINAHSPSIIPESSASGAVSRSTRSSPNKAPERPLNNPVCTSPGASDQNNFDHEGSRSTAFGTAHTHAEAAPHQSHSAGAFQGEPPVESPVRQSSRLRTMTEIAGQPTPSDAIGSIDLDINLMTSEDVEFHSIVSDRSSPVVPAKKRRRGLHGRAVRDDRGNCTSRDSSRVTSPPSSHPADQGGESSVREVENPTSLVEAPADGVDTDKKSPSRAEAPPSAGSIPKLSKTTKGASVRPANILTKPSPLRVDTTRNAGLNAPCNHLRGNSELDQGNDAATTGIGPQVSDLADAVLAPSRVFAHFNGSPSGYYPATCIDVLVGEEPRYKVRFDDGTVDTINAYGVRRLELRKGDNIKIDAPGTRTKAYVVEDLQKRQQPAVPLDPETPSRRGRKQQTQQFQLCSTDIHGHDTVIVSLKQRQPSCDGEQSRQRITFPVSQIYLTSTMWPAFKDRPFTHNFANLGSASVLPTPSERSSTPATPSSRTRRAKLFALPTARATMPRSDRDTGLFNNMIFAISNIVQDEKRKRITNLVQNHGGRVLALGFDELFDIPRLAMTSTGKPSPRKANDTEFGLKPGMADMGFTCLLADKHSRSAKYIQALALGIPCLSSRWVQDCISKQRIVPWDIYLLAAGESTILDGAVRSRQLPYYPAENARLSAMVENRAKLLDGMSVLLIMTKSEEKDMQNHPLLTYALGAARVCRAASIEAASNTVTDARANGQHWDWVYSHVNEKQAEKVLFGERSTGKKRKRARVEDESDANGNVKPRIVGHEFLIQSLILGRLVES